MHRIPIREDKPRDVRTNNGALGGTGALHLEYNRRTAKV